MFYSLYYYKSKGKFEDKEYLKLKCLVQVDPDASKKTERVRTNLTNQVVLEVDSIYGSVLCKYDDGWAFVDLRRQAQGFSPRWQ